MRSTDVCTPGMAIGVLLATVLLVAGVSESQSHVFSDGFELGTTAGWELSDEEILRELIDTPAPDAAEVSRVLAVLARRGGLPVQAQSGTFLFAGSCGATQVSIGGDFNAWTPVSTTHDGDLCWFETSIPNPEESGYKFYAGGNWVADPRARRFVYDAFGELSLVRSVAAHLERWFGFGPGFGLGARELEIWVPADGVFDRILYAHDGQNLFDPSASTGGWHLQDSVPPGVLAVGIHSVDRIDEYTPFIDDLGSGPTGGRGDDYADLVRFTIRSFVQGRYGSASVEGVLGSSLGGLISLHITQRYPDVFGFSASMSGTLGWGSIGPHNETIIERAQSIGHQSNVIYLDSGGSGTTCTDLDGDGIWDDDPTATDNYCVTLQMSTVLQGVGYTLDTDLWYWWEPDAPHNEAAWAARVWRPLQLFAGLPSDGGTSTSRR